MTIHVTYIETAGEFEGLLTVTYPDGRVKEMYVPKILMDLVKANLPSLNITNILARSFIGAWDL